MIAARPRLLNFLRTDGDGERTTAITKVPVATCTVRALSTTATAAIEWQIRAGLFSIGLVLSLVNIVPRH